jgi:glycosyltransferase involved in cell wall biosynthesis
MSSLEGFSKAYMEQYGTGRTYREGDVSSAKEVMLSFIDDEEENRAMGQRGFQRFKEDFDMQVVNRKLEELFTELIEGIL